MTGQSQLPNGQPIRETLAPTQPQPGQTPMATITATNSMSLARGHFNGDHSGGQERPAVSPQPSQRLNAPLNENRSEILAPTVPISARPPPQRLSQPSLANPFANTLSHNYDQNMFTGCAFTPLPKYTIVKRLLDPTVLTDREYDSTTFLFMISPFAGISFAANPHFRTLLAKNRWQILLRFSHTAEKGAKDSVPDDLCIDLNGTRVYTHSTDGQQRWCRPYDVSQWCGWGVNQIEFSLSSTTIDDDTEYGWPTLFEISIVSKLTVQAFVNSLVRRSGHRLSANETKAMIRRKIRHNSSDRGISVLDDCIQVSLICPISQRRLRIPCRTVQCQHIECFDGQSFFEANEWRSQWLCPICKASADKYALRVDTYFKEILANTPESVTTIRVKSNGNYDIVDRFDGQVVHSLDDSVADEDVVAISGNTEHSL